VLQAERSYLVLGCGLKHIEFTMPEAGETERAETVLKRTML
tara:strand:+ start:74 stop:196 length:123 start_codon:yes stop_codon:yes gene_type:complete